MISKDERKLLIGFAKNKPLFDAVRKQLLQGMIGGDFTDTNWIWTIDNNLADAAYGKKVKITKTAIEWLNKGFKDIKLMAMVPDENTEPVNEAR
jgi:hypothetical protein